MTEIDFNEMDRNFTEIENRMNKREEDGLKNVLKHFDRIHDKLFSINTMFIAGFFTLIKLSNNISTITILIPVLNMIYLIWIEYRMMEKSRFEADVKNKTPSEINKWGKSIRLNNWLSLFSITLTLIVAGYFIYFLYVSDKI
ncbi:hypothetical protein [Rhizosphaericola mali]|uniref:DUF202 domain-containing protein n=1 Tax=Rhizosphaericola mali TaxID=2545455 RepID=A0A5P2FV52_9BACT|nr:hypothetical protein [Rhizosphaericola mali]QES87354.1 hypothetical protein E0W69_001325 [Rhizosphaericola mali]